MTTRRLLALLAFAFAACGDRAHLTATHGKSYRAAFERSVANPRAKAAPPRGLDSQEAAIVSETFRRGLAPRDQDPEDVPVLLVAPPGQAGAPRLPPSIPPEGR